MGRLSLGRLGCHSHHRPVLVRRKAELVGSDPADATGTGADRFRFCRVFPFPRAARVRGAIAMKEALQAAIVLGCLGVCGRAAEVRIQPEYLRTTPTGDVVAAD